MDVRIDAGRLLRDSFLRSLGECRYSYSLGEALMAVGLGSWDELEPRLRELAKRKNTTPEKLVEDLLFNPQAEGAPQNAEEFVQLLLA